MKNRSRPYLVRGYISRIVGLCTFWFGRATNTNINSSHRRIPREPDIQAHILLPRHTGLHDIDHFHTNRYSSGGDGGGSDGRVGSGGRVYSW